MIRPTHVQVSRSALRHNAQVIRDTVPPETKIMAVVKDDCYGHGVTICVPEFLAAGLDFFGVSMVEEARQLRSMGVTSRIALLTTPVHGHFREMTDLDLDVLISNRRDAQEFSDCAVALGRRLRVHAYLDTGMTRNGAYPHEMPDLLAAIAEMPGLHVQGFASHFARSEEVDSDFSGKQLEIFDTTLRAMLDKGYRFEDIHIANSGGILNHPASHYSLVRPGIALYGYHPTGERQLESRLKPSITYQTEISSLRRVPAGTPISYGSTYYTTEETIIATLPLGFGDGLPRLFSNKLSALINGKRYPQVGTICMDESMLDIGQDESVKVGDEVVILGSSGEERNDAWELGRLIGTIPYEITTRISSRVPRIATP